jgi:hypothetical protein
MIKPKGGNSRRPVRISYHFHIFYNFNQIHFPFVAYFITVWIFLTLDHLGDLENNSPGPVACVATLGAPTDDSHGEWSFYLMGRHGSEAPAQPGDLRGFWPDVR